MKIIDKIGLTSVVEFTELTLDEYDTSKIDWIKLLPLNKKAVFHGMCTYPKRKAKRSREFLHGYQIRCSVNTKSNKWPFTRNIGTSTWRKDNLWGFNYTMVRFENIVEATIYLIGHEVFHFLRHSKQIPGRNTQCQANQFGLDWLEEFRILDW